MSGFKNFFNSFLSFFRNPDKTVEEKPKKTKKVASKKTTSKSAKKTTPASDVAKVAEKAEKVVKAIEIAKELQTDKGKARYMSRLRNALKKAIAAEAIDEIQKAETKVKNYLAKQKQK